MAILDDARHLGIDVLDTASQYGTAEVVLGQSLLDGFRVITKTPSFRGVEVRTRDVAELVRTFEDSLSRLGLERVHGLLLHDVDNLFVPGGKLLLSAMEELKAARKVEKIGVSVYDGRQIDAVLGMFAPDIVQLPLNVLDQRLLLLRILNRFGAVAPARIQIRDPNDIP